MRLGLKGRFVAFVSVIIIAFGVVLTALSVRAQNARLRHELEERGKLLTTVIAANATDPLAMLEVRELRKMISEARDQENVLDAVAFDEDGRVLTDGTVVNPRRHSLISEAALRHAMGSEALLVEFDGDAMTVTRPLHLGARVLGGIRLRYLSLAAPHWSAPSSHSWVCLPRLYSQKLSRAHSTRSSKPLECCPKVSRCHG